MKLSVIIPAYNEKNTILNILKRVKVVPVEKEIIVVDDCSNDGTREILSKLNDPQVKVVFHKKNYGKGHAIRTGLEHVTGDIVIIQDADLEYDPFDYPKLIEPIIQGQCKVVYGSRPKKRIRGHFYIANHLARKFLTWMANILYNAQITDEPTCYKVFSSDVIKSLNLKCERFEFCPEVTAKVKKKGYHIHEVPISYTPRSIEEGKKINWRDGLEAVWTLLKYRFVD